MLINKNDLPLVAMDFMNNTHFEDVDIINELYENILNYKNDSSSSNFQILASKYEEWVIHTTNHFKTEEDEMMAKKFFAYMFHKAEHDNNLNEIKNLWKSFESNKNIDILKEYFEQNLVSWLIRHIQSMDTVTAMFFKTGMSPCSMH